MESITLYSLGVYPQSPLSRQLQRGEVPSLAEDSVNIEMYLAAQEILSQAGYQQRNLTRFGLSGKDFVYMNLREAPNDCVCLGLWANGSIGPYIYQNAVQLGDYINQVEQGHLPVGYIYSMDRDEEMRSFFVRGLNAMSVDLDEFRRLYGAAAIDIFGDIIKGLADRGLLEYDDHTAKLSQTGIVWGHNVCEEFCSPTYLEASEKQRGRSRPSQSFGKQVDVCTRL
jgi:oxygen-independent coproporphyrinogen-3 oxidase